MDRNLEIRLFGGLRVAVDGVPLTDFMSAKAPALLAYLAVTRRAHRRDDLAALLWGEISDADARSNLRQVLTNLRRSLDLHLAITREEVALSPAAAWFVDVAAFESQLHPDPALSPVARAAQLDAAASLYCGDFLAGFFVRDAPAFEEWMLAQRARFRELALHALHALTQLDLDLGRYDLAIRDATRLLTLDEWREESHGQLMLALARTGQRSAALAQYQRCRRLLREEFGVEPSAETTDLYERIKATIARPRHNLPMPASELIGRTEDVAAVRQRLVTPECHLLTLIGPGGVGKTELALAVANAGREDRLDGAWWVELSALTGPGDLVVAIADALGHTFSGAESLAPQLLDYLRRKELLLVLDNFEHLISAPALDLLCQILRQAPGVTLMITSRVRLNLAAEWLYDVSGLAYPAREADLAMEHPAVQLFIRRARRVQPSFQPDPKETAAVARICRIAEGLPLAIELAAAWARAMTPDEIAAELGHGLAVLANPAHDAPVRHGSLTAVFEQSWGLLDDLQRRVLAQLAVFRGDFDRTAAAAIAEATPAVLQGLADRSLLRSSRPGRYDLHPLVRQFAGEKLAQQPEAIAALARDRHARHYAALAGRQECNFHCGQDRQALDWMLVEADNIRAAWEWGVQQADLGLLEPFLESFLYFYDIQGRYGECADLLREALRAFPADGETPERRRGLGRLLALHAAFAFRLGAFDQAGQEATRALVLLEPLRPHRDIGHARLYLGAARYGSGDLAGAVAWFLAAIEAYRESGHDWGIGAALDNAGYLEFLRGDLAAAKAHLMHALDIAQKTGSRYLLMGVQDHLATVACAEHRFDEAMRYAERCHEVLNELDRPYIVASLSLSLAQIATQAGDLAAAERHLQRALDVARNTGNRLDIVKTLIELGRLRTARGDAVAARQALSEAAAIGQEIRAESLLVGVAEAFADLAQTEERGAAR
jgi:predicted ATPase